MLLPRETGKFVAENSQDVTISKAGIEKTAKMIYNGLKTDNFSTNSWKTHELHPKEMIKENVDWIFCVDTLNFSFWTNTKESEKFVISYKGKHFTGYWSLCAAVQRALDEGIPITTPSYYSTITKDKLAYIFRSSSKGHIPLLDERWHNLKEAGKILTEKFDGSFVNCIDLCNNSAEKLLELVTTTFKSFQDTAIFQGKTVSFYKRAQILIADIWGLFEGNGYGYFKDIEFLTMFADYRVPQALVYTGALIYSSNLLQLLESDELLLSGSRLEVEIRGCSIWAIELICEELKRNAQSEGLKFVINSIIVDFYLWDYAQQYRQEMASIPFHKVRTIYY